MGEFREQQAADLRATITECAKCPIHRKKVLFEGSPPCEVVYVAEAPGRSELPTGRPLIGRSGQFFRQHLLDHMPEHTHILTNVISCFPAKKGTVEFRPPSKKEKENCLPFLEQLIDLAVPRLLVGLGAVASSVLKRMDLDIPIVELTHPSAHLRAGGVRSPKYFADFNTLQRQLSIHLSGVDPDESLFTIDPQTIERHVTK